MEGLTKPEPEEGDLLVAVDVAAVTMFPREYESFRDSIDLRIDHHGSASSFTEYELVEPEAGACGEIIYDLAMELWQDLDPETADALYVALSTDTGCFRFANTTDHSFLVAAACARAGARVFQLNQEIFETVSLTKLKIQSWIVENMKVMDGGRLALVAIPKAVEDAIGVTEDDMDNISSFPRNISGVCMAATLRESKEGGSKLSVRAVPAYDATAVATKFGGGGHRGTGRNRYGDAGTSARRCGDAPSRRRHRRRCSCRP
jgi:phosphoesterase RecJ-like protein